MTLTYQSITLGLMVLGTVQGGAQALWINEFHYDNYGSDVGEFVEVAAPSSFTDLANVSLTLYNGKDGASYGSRTLDTFDSQSASGDFVTYDLSISGIQNGAPDGFSLDHSGNLLQFLSYEGSFDATSGPAAGSTSTDVLFSETSTDPAGGSIGLTGSGSSYADFQWAKFTTASPGAVNAGQTFTAVPEPREFGWVAGLFLAGYALCRKRPWRQMV